VCEVAAVDQNSYMRFYGVIGKGNQRDNQKTKTWQIIPSTKKNEVLSHHLVFFSLFKAMVQYCVNFAWSVLSISKKFYEKT